MRHLSNEHKKKISESVSKNHQSKKEGYINPFKGKHHSIETKNKMREKKKLNPTNFWLGKHRSPFSKETKRKMSESQIGRKVKSKTRHKLRLSRIKYLKNICNFIYPRIGHNEKKILDKLEYTFNHKIIRQYKVEGYFVDGYIPEWNIVIEVDERPKNKEKDIERQKIIEEKLKCKFIRIKDYD